MRHSFLFSSLFRSSLLLACALPGLAAAPAVGQTVTSLPSATTVGQTSPPAAVTVTLTASGTAGSVQALTQGVAVSDFVLSPGGTCAANAAYLAGQQCTVNVVLTPKYPGLRHGAVEVLSANGSLLGMSLVSGQALGSLIMLTPGWMNTIAGDGSWVYLGDGMSATATSLFLPMGVVTDTAGNIFISDASNDRIRRVDAVTGLISTIAGSGFPGSTGDGGPAVSATLDMPIGICVDGAGNIYFADSGNHVIRRIDAISGILTTVAGKLGVHGYTGDGGPATSATLFSPSGVTFDAAGDMFVADTDNNVVREVNAATGTIQTVAGTGTAGYNGDSIQATTAQLNGPWSTTIGPDGFLYIADMNNNRVRQVNAAGIIATFAGNGVQGYTESNGTSNQASQLEFNAPTSMSFDPAGRMFIADSGNNRIREVDVVLNVTTIVGGSNEQFYGDGGPADLASLYGPYAVYFDDRGNILIADMFHNRIREVAPSPFGLVYGAMKVGTVSAPQTNAIENHGNANLIFQSAVLTNAQIGPLGTALSGGCSEGAIVTPAHNCLIDISFAPTTVGDPVTGQVSLPSNASNGTAIYYLSGQVLSVQPSTILLTSNANPAAVGASVTFAAAVSSASPSLTGTVTFLDGTTTLCSVPLNANGGSVCATALLTLGQHSITARYSGDADDAASVSAPLIEVIKQVSVLALTASPNPVTASNNVTLTATATAPTGTPTGTVTFYDGTTVIGSAPLNASGVVTFSTTQLSIATHILSAQYAGDPTNTTATSNSVSEVVQIAATATTMGASTTLASAGTSVTLSVNVVSSGGPEPTGTVQFTDNGVALGSATLNGFGAGSISTTALPPGPNQIVATYSGDTDNATSASAGLTVMIQQLNTTIAVASNSNPAKAGAAVQLTATVALAAGATADGAVTGNVTFLAGTNVLGTAPLGSNGLATFTVSSFAAGTQSIQAVYSGNTIYATSTSAWLSEVVQQTGTTTALSGSAASLSAGQNETLTATVTSSTGIPTGTVNFVEAGVVFASAQLNAQGVATFSTSSLPVGSDAIQAVYTGNGSYTTSTGSMTLVVQQAATATALATSVTPQISGKAVTFTASVASADAGLTGTVNFMDGATPLGSVTLTPNGVGPLSANGLATLTTTTLASGPHSITAAYSGDTNHATSTSAALSEQIVQAATAALASSVNPSVSGQNVVFTAKIGGVGTTIPTGTVTFKDGTTTLGTATLDATGTATYATATLIVGSHPITASYGGDTNYSTTSASLAQTVGSATTQVALTASANPATYGTPLVLTATITSNGSPATGTVTFTDGGTAIGTGTLNANGVATLTSSTLAPGAHTIVANYGGDQDTSLSLSAPLALVVKETTAVALTSNGNPAQTLSPVVLTATVTNRGVGVPTGSVTFTDGTTVLGTVTVDGSGNASLTVPSMTMGSHPITASYAGDSDNFASVSGALNENVALRPTTTALTATQTDPTNPQSVTLIAVVSGNGSTPPTGIATFMAGSATLGSAQINAIGVATLTITLQDSSESVAAAYSGDASYAASSSLATAVSSGAPSQFKLAINPPALTLVTKQKSAVTVTLTSVQSFADTMELGCVGLPYAATCTFTNAQGGDASKSALAANGTMSVQLTIDTGDPLGAGATASLTGEKTSGVMFAFLPAGLLLGLGLLRKGKSRRKLRKLGGLVLAICAMVLTISATGCSGLSVNGTPPGTYTFGITATGQGTGATQTQTMTLTVTGQ